MDRREWSAVLNKDRDFQIKNVIFQHWRENKYSYKDTPRPDFGLMCVLRGGVDFVTEEHTLSVRKGGVVFLPKGSCYEAVFVGETEDILVNFDVEDLPHAFSSLFLLEANGRLVSSFEALVADAEKAGPLCIKGRFYLLLDELVQEKGRDKSREEVLIERACSCLRSEEDLSVVDIARMCAVSESGLRRLFKMRAGQTLLAYRRAHRLEEAKRLLENTDLSLAEIAERVHFFDAAYFSHVFRRAFGIPPGEYAKEKKKRL